MENDHYARQHNENYWAECPEEFSGFLEPIKAYFEHKFEDQLAEYLNEAIEDNELWFFLEEQHNQALLTNEKFKINNQWISTQLDSYAEINNELLVGGQVLPEEESFEKAEEYREEILKKGFCRFNLQD